MKRDKFKKIMALVLVLVVVLLLSSCKRTPTDPKPIILNELKWHQYILMWPIAQLMGFFGGLTGNSFGFGILLTTIVIRTLAWPIYAKSNDMSLKMKLAQPDMQRVQMKYANRKDPESQQRMQMEMMQVYKKHNVNMATGCLLPLLQMPIFITMYNVVNRITIEGGSLVHKISNHMFLGINLSDKNMTIVTYILAALVGLTMYLLQTISTKQPKFMKNTARHNLDDQAKQQESMMKFMSYFMIIMMVMASLSSKALAFYWIIGNIYSIGQTLLGRKIQEKNYYKSKNELIHKG